MDVATLISRIGDTVQVRRGFGQAYEVEGATVIPVAVVAGGGGGGGGEQEQAGSGAGAGTGLAVRPIGVFVVRDGEVTWRPCVDVTRLAIVAAGLVGAVLLRRRRP
jgi:uncharacterized spore protein YtfJ